VFTRTRAITVENIEWRSINQLNGYAGDVNGGKACLTERA